MSLLKLLIGRTNADSTKQTIAVGEQVKAETKQRLLFAINTKVYFVPYLVAFISSENILIVTRSIIESPAHLDVKIRVAQGLGKEGWNMTKNLFCEITILTAVFIVVGFMDSTTQEFCTLAVMGLLADFFLRVTAGGPPKTSAPIFE